MTTTTVFQAPVIAFPIFLLSHMRALGPSTQLPLPGLSPVTIFANFLAAPLWYASLN